MELKVIIREKQFGQKVRIRHMCLKRRRSEAVGSNGFEDRKEGWEKEGLTRGP